MAKYVVRKYPLHKVVTNNKGVRSIQIYQDGESVELTDAEYQKYERLVEPEAQAKLREPEKPAEKTTKTK